MATPFTPEAFAIAARLEEAGWEVTYRYATGFAPTWEAKKFVLPGDPLHPRTGPAKVLVSYTAGEIAHLAKTCGVT